MSAGPSEPLKLLEDIIDEGNEGPETTKINQPAEQEADTYSEQEDADGSGEDELIGPDDLEEALQTKDIPKDDTPDAPRFFFDLKGDQSQERGGKPTVEIPDRPPSRSSTSSDEVILFKGRGAPRKPEPVPQPAPEPVIDMMQMQAEIRVVEQAITTEPIPLAPSPAPELPTEPARNKKATKKDKKQKEREKRKEVDRVKEEEDAILADYIANLKENTDVDEYFKELIQGGMVSDDDSEMSEPFDANDDDQNEPDVDESDAESEEDLEATNKDDMPSEIDDETLARLIAGHELGYDLGMDDYF